MCGRETHPKPNLPLQLEVEFRAEAMVLPAR